MGPGVQGFLAGERQLKRHYRGQANERKDLIRLRARWGRCRSSQVGTPWPRISSDGVRHARGETTGEIW